MADEKKSKLHPQQWLGRPILSPEHVQDLETKAAINEFHHKMPRQEAEQRAHDDYVKEHRERAAAHHLAGMKAAMATGNHEDARKHWAMYDLHLKSLGKESIGSVPPEIEKRMMDDGADKPVYKFKAHKGDLYALHQPSKDVAPEQGHPIQKSEERKTRVYECQGCGHESKVTTNHTAAIHQNCTECSWKGVKIGKDHHGPGPREHHYVGELPPEHPNHAVVDGGGERSAPKTGHLKVVKAEELEKGEAKQCKWRLGERRCQRMVTTGYCHDHVDHWANKIKQKEASAEQSMEKEEKKDLPKCPHCGTPTPADQLEWHHDSHGWAKSKKVCPDCKVSFDRSDALHPPAEKAEGVKKAFGYEPPEDSHGEWHHCTGNRCGTFRVDRRDGKAKDGSPKCPACGGASEFHDWENSAHDGHKDQPKRALLDAHQGGEKTTPAKTGHLKVVKHERLETVETARVILKGIYDLLKGQVINFPQGGVTPAQDLGQDAKVVDLGGADQHVRTGYDHQVAGNVQGAMQAYHAALQANPQNPTAHFNLGVIHQDLGDHAKALEHYHQGLAAEPNDPDMHFNTAQCYQNLGDSAKASHHLQQARALGLNKTELPALTKLIKALTDPE